MPFHHHSFQPILKSNLNSSEHTFYNLSNEITYFPINPLLSPLCLYQPLFYTFLVHYSYGCNIPAHDDELWGPSPERYSRKKGENSSLLRDSFSCHILLCSPTATNTISLNNLVFVGKNVPGSAPFIFAYQLDVCDEKNNSLCVLEEKKLGRVSVYLYFLWTLKWAELSDWKFSANYQHMGLDLWPLSLHQGNKTWYLSGALFAINHRLSGRWTGPMLSQTHRGTFQRARSWIHLHSRCILSTDLTGSLPRLPCYNVLLIKTIRKRQIFAIPCCPSYLHKAAWQLALPRWSAHFSAAGCRCSSQLHRRWWAWAASCWCCRGRCLTSAADDYCSGISSWHFGCGMSLSTGKSAPS